MVNKNNDGICQKISKSASAQNRVGSVVSPREGKLVLFVEFCFDEYGLYGHRVRLYSEILHKLKVKLITLQEYKNSGFFFQMIYLYINIYFCFLLYQ